MIMRNERQLWICGDIHGELSGLVRNSVNRGISCADILVVGDFGAGFGRPKSMDVAYSRVCDAYPRQCGSIRRSLEALHRCERENREDPDGAAETFAEMMAEVFVFQEDHWTETMRRLDAMDRASDCRQARLRWSCASAKNHDALA